MKKNYIISKDPNIEPIIYNILNEAYHEFVSMYGEKHSEYIKETIESITDKVRKSVITYDGPSAAASTKLGVVYNKADDLSAILKHELWHVYNNSASDMEKSIQHVPERYLSQLEKTGYLQELYQRTMEEYREKFKDAPERLKFILVDYEKWRNDRFGFGSGQVELWTEWFNSETHLEDMQDNFWDWQDGFFTESHSSKSYYDSYINLAGIMSCIIPKEKLLEMYLQNGDYITDYSYPEMQDEFDSKYADSLEGDEKEKYQYPYMKIMMDIQTIDENARKNPKLSRETLQSCIKTLFNAYLIKLENTENLDIEGAQQIFSEIKCMQKNMLWNTDISKMEGLDYIQALKRIEDKFRDLVSNLDIENLQVQEMLEKIDYISDNPFKMVENGEFISQKILECQSEDLNTVFEQGEFKAAVGLGGIKNNLYRSLFVLLGDEKFNLLYEQFNNGQENILLDITGQIENATTDEEIKKVYNNIYQLYEKKMEDTLRTDENISHYFDRYSKDIVKLQENGIFNEKNNQYLPELEKIIELYQQKVQEYVGVIDKITEEDIQRNLSEGRDYDTSKRFAQRIPNMYKTELYEQENRIITQREMQLRLIEDKKVFTTKEIGQVTVSAPIQAKQEAIQMEIDEKAKEGEKVGHDN
jgi:hypothetical protein